MNKKNFFTTIILALLLMGCAIEQKKPQYYWAGYQPELYQYYLHEKSEQEQIIVLRQIIANANAENMPIPPGLYAHLGMLLANNAAMVEALEAFANERSLFPEATPYMDFLTRKLTPEAL